MAALYRKYGDIDQAFEYVEKYETLADSIFSLNTHIEANALKIKYDVDKKEAELTELKLTNDLKEKDLKITRQNSKLVILFSVFGFLLTAFGFQFYRLKQKSELALKEHEIKSQLNIITSLRQDIVQAGLEREQQSKSITIDELNSLISKDLTEREYEILQLVLDGHSNQEIANKIYLSVNTIKFHLKKVYAKLDVSNRMEIMQLLIKK